jgi:hypothetical protein
MLMQSSAGALDKVIGNRCAWVTGWLDACDVKLNAKDEEEAEEEEEEAPDSPPKLMTAQEQQECRLNWLAKLIGIISGLTENHLPSVERCTELAVSSTHLPERYARICSDPLFVALFYGFFTQGTSRKALMESLTVQRDARRSGSASTSLKKFKVNTPPEIVQKRQIKCKLYRWQFLNQFGGLLNKCLEIRMTAKHPETSEEPTKPAYARIEITDYLVAFIQACGLWNIIGRSIMVLKFHMHMELERVCDDADKTKASSSSSSSSRKRKESSRSKIDWDTLLGTSFISCLIAFFLRECSDTVLSSIDLSGEHEEAILGKEFGYKRHEDNAMVLDVVRRLAQTSRTDYFLQLWDLPSSSKVLRFCLSGRAI